MRDLNELLPKKDIEEAASGYSTNNLTWIGFCAGAEWASKLLYTILEEEFQEEMKNMEYEIWEAVERENDA